MEQEIKFSIDGHREALDFVSVWSLVHKHPLSSAEQMDSMLQHLCDLSRQESFRQWWSAHVDDEMRRAVIRNVFAHWDVSERHKVAPAVVICKNLCLCSAALQRDVVLGNDIAWDRLCTKFGSGSKLAAQCISNLLTGNAECSTYVLSKCEPFRVAALDYLNKAISGDSKANTLCILLHNAWTACRQSSSLISELLPFVEEKCNRVHSDSALLVRCLLESGVAPVPCSASSFFACLESYPVLLGNAGVPERIMTEVNRHRHDEVLHELLAALATGAASEETGCRLGCLELTRHGLLEVACELLEDRAWELDVGPVLQLLGNIIYRNDEVICEKLLALNAFSKILKHSRFDPLRGTNREWALVCIRNATEVSTAVHKYLSEMQYLGIDRSDGQVDALEKKMGAKLEVDEAGKLKVHVEGSDDRPLVVATSKMFSRLNPEDQLLCKMLTSQGFTVRIVVWNEEMESFDWSSCQAVIVRTVWDYHRNPLLFQQWLDLLDENGVRVFNSSSILRWNHHKKYLVEMGKQGIPVVPSVLLEAGTKTSLTKVCASFDTKYFVMKPCVGSFGEGVVKFALNDSMSVQRAEQLQSSVDCLLQPFVASVSVRGETSLIFIDGSFSHAVLKVPPRGDFRVQGGSITIIPQPDDNALAVAKKALQAVPLKGGVLMFARVDLVLYDGAYVVSEMECLDPELFVTKCADSSAVSLRFAKAIASRIRKSK